MMKYKNPFPILDYDSPELFCNRNDELTILLKAYKNNRNITLTSIRRLGKTGLIKHLFFHINANKNKNITLLYVDILKTRNLADFVKVISNQILKYEAKKTNWLKKLGSLISGIRAQISIDENTGSPSIQIDYKTAEQSELSIEKIFEYLASQKEEYLIAIDEFQQITNYPEQNVEAILRTHIQHQHKDRFIFSGSSKHILISMFNDYGRPFYQSSEVLNLNRLDIDEYSMFIKNKFTIANKSIHLDLIKQTVKYLDIHTFYVQYVFNKLYDMDKNKIEKIDIDALIDTILQEKEYVFINYRNILTSGQFQLLEAIAKEQSVLQPNASSFLRKYELKNASSINRTLKALVDKEMVYHENGAYKVYDVFLSKWLEKN